MMHRPWSMVLWCKLMSGWGYWCYVLWPFLFCQLFRDISRVSYVLLWCCLFSYFFLTICLISKIAEHPITKSISSVGTYAELARFIQTFRLIPSVNFKCFKEFTIYYYYELPQLIGTCYAPMIAWGLLYFVKVWSSKLWEQLARNLQRTIKCTVNKG